MTSSRAETWALQGLQRQSGTKCCTCHDFIELARPVLQFSQNRLALEGLQRQKLTLQATQGQLTLGDPQRQNMTLHDLLFCFFLTETRSTGSAAYRRSRWAEIPACKICWPCSVFELDQKHEHTIQRMTKITFV